MFDQPDDATHTIATIAAVTLLAVGLMAMPVAVAADGDVSNATTETSTSTETPTPTPTPSDSGSAADGDACDPGPQDPNLRQLDLHTTDSVVAEGDPAEIAGIFRLSSASECPVQVAISLSVPNDMYIEGGQNIDGSASALATGEFVVDDGDPKEVRATVYSLIEGEQIVTADVEYWPVGHPEELRTQTFRLSIDVEASEAPPETPTVSEEEPTETPHSGGSGPGSGGESIPEPLSTDTLLIGLVGLSIVFLGAIGYKGATAEVVAKFINR